MRKEADLEPKIPIPVIYQGIAFRNKISSMEMEKRQHVSYLGEIADSMIVYK